MNAIHEDIEFAASSGTGTIPGWLYRPASGTGMGLCMIHDVYGLRPEYDEIAEPFVDHGYTVLLPNMFHDVEPVTETDDKGKKFSHWRGLSDDAAGMTILDAGVRALHGMPGTGGRVAVTGFCFGGTLSYLAAARRGDIVAAAGYFATSVHKYLDEAPNIRCPLIMHTSESDSTDTEEQAAAQRTALLDVPLALGLVYPGTVHGFTLLLHPAYNAEMTSLAHLRSFALFDQA